jgi:hypothetical protein
MSVTRLRGSLQAFAKKRSNFQIFCSSESTHLWKIAYFGVAAFLFVSAAQNRFSLPQDPLADTDFGYLWPALNKLGGGAFEDLNAVNFLYPGFVYIILRMLGDFRAITILQHLLGLAAGGLFLASWNRIASFFPRPRLQPRLHQGMGLCGAGIYLLSNSPVLFESQIRSDAVCMFFEILSFWFAIEFFYHRTITRNGRRAILYAFGAMLSCSLLASLKPSFSLTSLLIVGSVGSLVLGLKRMLAGKIVFFGASAAVIVILIVLQQFFSRGDEVTKRFLPQTLFAFHAKIIQAQMRADLNNGAVPLESRVWLESACDDLDSEIRRTHALYPTKYRRLGYEPDYLVSGPDALLARWNRELGDPSYLQFLGYWYRHSLVGRPLAFARKVAQQMAVFYSLDCPAFGAHRRLSLDYNASLAALSNPTSRRLLAQFPAGVSFVERTEHLRSSDTAIDEIGMVRSCEKFCRRSYLSLLVLTLAVAGWLFLKPEHSAGGLAPVFLVLGFYAANLGNVLGISVIHSMEVGRYSAVQFIAALFAQFWAIRWLMELGLTKRASLMPADAVGLN